MSVSKNELISLPDLPEGLGLLDVDSNQLTELPELPQGLKRLRANNNKLKTTINWRPKHFKLSTIVKSCIKWEKQLTGKS